MDKAPELFISYAHGNSSEATRFKAVLEKLGWSVWLDVRMKPGDRIAPDV